MLPEGGLRARIRGSKRETLNAKEGTLADTLGEASPGLIVVARGGIPLQDSNLTLWEQIVASQHSRVEVEVPGEGGRGCDPQEPVDEEDTTEGQTGSGGEKNGNPGEAGSPGYSIIVEGGSNTVDLSEIESGSGSIAEETTRIIYSTNVVNS